jgi:UV DNA damage endonuclease
MSGATQWRCRDQPPTFHDVRLGYACLTLGMPEPSMRTAQLGRFERGLVELAPIYAYNVQYARRSLAYAWRHGLDAYRLSSDLFPLLDRAPRARSLVPPLPGLRDDIARLGMHVSNHPSQFVVLSSPHRSVLANSMGVLRDTGWVMERIGASGSITLHGGGVYDDRASAAARLAATARRVPKLARHRLALENDERCWTVPELLDATSGDVPVVFDKLHWAANPRSAAYDLELGAALSSWPPERVPEVHYSEQAPGKPRGAHSDWLSGKGLFEFVEEVAEAARGRDVAIIVEAKKKDLAIALAIDELDRRARARLAALVPGLARAPRDWAARAARLAA